MINIYCRLTEVVAEKENLSIPHVNAVSNDVISELKDMGIIAEVPDFRINEEECRPRQDFLSFL